jgi:hypothetical protein
MRHQLLKVFTYAGAIGLVFGVIALLWWFYIAPPAPGEQSIAATAVPRLLAFPFGFALIFASMATPAYFVYRWFKDR